MPPGRRKYCSDACCRAASNARTNARGKLQRNARAPAGFIYILVHPRLEGCKIGKTACPPHRLRVYNTGCPRRQYEMVALLAVPDRMAADKKARAILAPWQIDGEWFALSPDEVLERIQELTLGTRPD